MKHEVSVLYTRSDSVYKTLGVDCWDIHRDARNWPGGNPIVAHPPCRAWGKFKAFSKHPEHEKELARESIRQIRKYGGVLEHPGHSSLWKEMNLPMPGEIDEYGGYSICVDQSWWGHKAQKRTLLYIVGVDKKDLPEIPIRFDRIDYVINNSRTNPFKRKEVSKKEREETPIEMAKWLITVAKKARKSKMSL